MKLEADMTTFSRTLTMLFAMLLCAGLWGHHQAKAQQQEIANTGLSGEMKSLTATVGPGSEVVLLAVPNDSNFVVTQACHTTGTGTNYRLQNVGGGGANAQATLDNTACQEYTPGLVYYGGDEVLFRNNSGSTTVRVLVNGIVTKK
jgi:hypothetical protein